MKGICNAYGVEHIKDGVALLGVQFEGLKNYVKIADPSIIKTANELKYGAKIEVEVRDSDAFCISIKRIVKK